MDLENFTLDLIGLGEEKEAVQAKKLCRVRATTMFTVACIFQVE